LTRLIGADQHGPVLIRRETAADIPAIRAVHAAAFGRPAEAGLVDALRADAGWLPALSLVATEDGRVVGHVVCTRARIGTAPALGLGPLGVRPETQRHGVGHALMHAVLGAADALDEPIVVLLGHRDYYPRFGFRPAADLGITPPVPEWASHFQARPLTAYRPSLCGEFAYARPFLEM
jgi:putative acetyltransferase